MEYFVIRLFRYIQGSRNFTSADPQVRTRDSIMTVLSKFHSGETPTSSWCKVLRLVPLEKRRRGHIESTRSNVSCPYDKSGPPSAPQSAESWTIIMNYNRYTLDLPMKRRGLRFSCRSALSSETAKDEIKLRSERTCCKLPFMHTLWNSTVITKRITTGIHARRRSGNCPYPACKRWHCKNTGVTRNASDNHRVDSLGY